MIQKFGLTTGNSDFSDEGEGKVEANRKVMTLLVSFNAATASMQFAVLEVDRHPRL